MDFKKLMVRSALALCLGGVACWLWLPRSRAADAVDTLPPVLEDGFTLWTKGGSIDTILGMWQKGGLMEGNSKVGQQANYLRGINQYAGAYRSHETLQVKYVGRGSQVVYAAINLERAAVYARFMLYRAPKGWVVQNMDFNVRPEALMPWLAIENDRASEN